MGTTQMKAMAEVGLKNRELDIRKGQVIQEALAKQAELEAQARAESRKPPVLAEIPVARGEQTVQWYPDTQSFGPPTVVLPDGVVDEGVTPMDIPTVEGPFIPANEGVISEDGKTVNYLGKIYTIDPSVLPPIIPSPATDIPNNIGFKPYKENPLVQVNTGDDPQEQRLAAIDKSLLETKSESAQAASQLPKIEEISKLLNKGVETGFAQDILMQGKRIFGQDVSDQEAFKAASGNVALGFINLTKGAISDKEMQYFTTVLAPSIGTSVEGNKKIVEFLRKAAAKSAKVEAIISNGMRNGKSAFDIDDEVQKFRNAETETMVPKEVGGIDGIYEKHGIK
jgi:hypothetical protein